MKSFDQIGLGLLFMQGHLSAATLRALREEQELAAVAKATPTTVAKVVAPCCPAPLANCA